MASLLSRDETSRAIAEAVQETTFGLRRLAALYPAAAAPAARAQAASPTALDAGAPAERLLAEAAHALLHAEVALQAAAVAMRARLAPPLPRTGARRRR